MGKVSPVVAVSCDGLMVGAESVDVSIGLGGMSLLLKGASGGRVGSCKGTSVAGDGVGSTSMESVVSTG